MPHVLAVFKIRESTNFPVEFRRFWANPHFPSAETAQRPPISKKPILNCSNEFHGIDFAIPILPTNFHASKKQHIFLPQSRIKMSKIPIRTPDAQLVTIHTVSDSVKAEMIKSLLADHDIPCELGGEHQAGFTGALAIEVIVRQEDAMLATQIVNDHNLA